MAMLDNNAREVGMGVATGTYGGYNAVYVTEDFGVSGTNSFLTGAVYNDANGNNFYDLNEGVQGVTAKVTTTGGTLVRQRHYRFGRRLVGLRARWHL